MGTSNLHQASRFLLLTLLRAGYSVKKYKTIFYVILPHIQSWRSCTRCDCKNDWLWVRSPLEGMKYLLQFIFPFFRSDFEAKRGVEVRHSTRNASRTQWKLGNSCSIQPDTDDKFNKKLYKLINLEAINICYNQWKCNKKYIHICIQSL